MKKQLVSTDSQTSKRRRIAEQLRASFRIEGIHITAQQAQEALQKVALSLDKAAE